MSTPENAGLRISGVGSIRRTDLPTEQPVIANLPMMYVGVSPQVKRTTVMDTRPGRRSIPLHAIADGAEPKGKLTILSVPGPILAMMMLGRESVIATAGGTVSTPEAHQFVSGYAVQLDHDHIDSLVVYPGVRATLATGTVNDKNGITWTAIDLSTGGNATTLTLHDAAEASTPLSVSVTGTAITVTLKNTSGSAVVSTAAEVIAAVQASAAASALVSVALTTGTGNDGSGVVAAATVASLSGGSNTGTAWALGTDYELVDALEGQIRVIAGGAGGALNATGTLFATYAHGAISGQTIVVGTDSQIEVEVRFRGTNDLANESGQIGADRRFFARRLSITPTGEINLAGEEPVKAEFDAIPLAPATGNSVEIQAPVYG